MEDLKNKEVPEAAESGVEEVEPIETEGNVLYRAFLAKFERLRKDYLHSNKIYHMRRYGTGTTWLMTNIRREQEKRLYGRRRDMERNLMKEVVAYAAKTISKEDCKQFEELLREHQGTIGFDFVDELLQKLNLK